MSNIYKIKIYNKTWGTGSGGTLVSVLDEVSNVSIRREVSKLAHAEFEVPRTNSKLSDITIGKKVRIERIDNGNLEYEGLVVGPLDKDQNPVKVNTINRGFLFGQVLTPWNFEFENTSYTDIINNELPYEYKFFRQVSGDDFAAGTFINTATINVASGVTPSDEDVWIGLEYDMTVRATLQTDETYGGIAKSGDHVYIVGANNNKFYSIKTSDPTAPTVVGSVASADAFSFLGSYGIAISEDYAYVTTESHAEVITVSIASPANPSIATSLVDINSLWGCRGITASGAYLYTAVGNLDTFTAISISSPSTPAVANYITSSTLLYNAQDVAISGNYAYVTGQNSDTLAVIDISTPSVPSLTTAIQAHSTLNQARGIAISGDYACVAAFANNGIGIVSIASPATPTITSEITTSTLLNGVYGIDVSGNYVYGAAYWADTLAVVNIASPSNPTMHNSISTKTSLDNITGVLVSDNYAYIANGTTNPGFAIADVAGHFYVSQGTYISQSIDLGDELSNSTSNGLARVRFQATKGQTGDIDVKVRHKKTGGSWDNWSTAQTLEFEDEMKHLGLTTFSVPATHQHVQTAWELSVNTAYSQATSFTPVVEAFELVGQYEQQDFSIGSVDTETEGERITANFKGHLRVFNDIADSWDKQWKITNNGTIITQATMGSNLASSVMLIEEENCNVDGYRSSDKDMANVVWGLGHGEGLNRLYYEASNSTNSNTYGARKTRKRFTVFAQSTLNTKTSSYLNEYTDPTYEIPVDVIEIPSTHVEAGDVVRFKSNRLDVDANYQVMTEHRYEDNTGERLQMELANQIQNYTGRQVETQEQTDAKLAASIKNYSSGDITSGLIDATDISWKEYAINVGWKGEIGNAEVSQVYDVSTDSYSTAGVLAEAEIARYTDKGMVIRYRRTNTGSDQIRVYMTYEIRSTEQ